MARNGKAPGMMANASVGPLKRVLELNEITYNNIQD
jgi:hypothetical protein